MQTREIIRASLKQARTFREQYQNLHIRLAPEMPCYLLFNQDEMLIHPYLTSAVGRATEVGLAVKGSPMYEDGVSHFSNYWDGRWVLFDLGNVLIPFDHAVVSTELWKWLKDIPIHEVPTREAIHSFFFENRAVRESRNHEAERGGKSLESIWGEFCDSVRADKHFASETKNYEHFQRIWNSIFGRIAPGAVQCIGDLQQMGISVGICSNTNESHWKHILGEYGQLTGAVSCSSPSFLAKCRKPEREFFEWIGRHTHAPACHHLLVDDLADNVAGAQAAGMHAEVFTDFGDVLKSVRERFWTSRLPADVAAASV